ncbi:MAG: rubredoxin, partial [Cytophagaceae bacterium]
LISTNPVERNTLSALKNEEEPKKVKVVHQCQKCLSIYDPQFGDESAGVAPGIQFNELPSDYLCGVCEATRNSFTPISMEKLTA